ncbi:unnamed protein product [Dovyalis caffra]|uniref:Regulatory protein RecX n=1 Tax=Dovyalis caffra TaxID=77055 RepID=A0AAV1S4Y4_9ROSI|nr:unnamed protein product [Dovyalis caffra]
MSILAGNLASKISLSLQFRVPFVQLVKRNNAILCLKGREFNSSSVPVRYTPKRYSKSDEIENSLPLKGNEKRVFRKNLDSARGNSGLNDKAKGQKVNEKRVCENSLPVKSSENRHFDKNVVRVRGNFGLNEKMNNRKQICNESQSFDDARQVMIWKAYASMRFQLLHSPTCSIIEETIGFVPLDAYITTSTFPIVKQNAQEVTAFSQLEEKINHELGPTSHQLMGEPEEDVEEGVVRQEKDISNESMIVRKIMQDAEKAAVGLLARRAYTAVELKKKLLGKRFALDIVEAMISDFQSRGLINDGLYAETFSRSRWSSSTWGPRRIKKALSNKGVSEADADKALKLVFEDDDSDEQDSKVGLSKISMDQLLVQASKQWLRGQDVPKDTRKSRLIRWLQYRGFNWDVVNFVLKKLESLHTS